MGFYKKTILLSNQANYGKGMAILTIEKGNFGVFGTLKCFDISYTYNLMLGISVDDKQVFKQHINLTGGNVYNFKLDNSIDVDGKIGSVIVSVDGDCVEPILWGTNGSKAQYKQDIINVFKRDMEKPPINIESAQIKVDKLDQDNEQVKNEEYKPELFDSTDEEIEEILDENLGGEFYNLIHGQIDELFEMYPQDDILQRLIPNSRWVKIDYENNGKEYVLGLIFADEKIKYICYGVPGAYEKLPPEDLQKYSQWISINDENNDGYWLMYQDADSGESIVFDDVNMS